MTDITKQKKMYEAQSAKQRYLLEHQMFLLDAEFLELIHDLDPQYQVPGRFKLVKN